MQNGYFDAVAQSSLIVSPMPQTIKPLISPFKHAKRPAKTGFVLYRYPPHSLRRHDPSAAFLQQAQTTMAPSEIYQDPSIPCYVSSLRPHPRPSLCHHGRITKNQQDRDLTIQRGVSFPPGTLPIPRSIHAPTISQTASPQSHPPTRRLTRSTSSSAVFPAQAPNDLDFRSGLRRAHGLWKTPVCQSRIQPQEAWSPILSSPPMLRSPFAGILAWVLRLPHDYHYRDQFEKALQKIDKLRFS